MQISGTRALWLKPQLSASTATAAAAAAATAVAAELFSDRFGCIDFFRNLKADFMPSARASACFEEICFQMNLHRPFAC